MSSTTSPAPSRSSGSERVLCSGRSGSSGASTWSTAVRKVPSPTMPISRRSRRPAAPFPSASTVCWTIRSAGSHSRTGTSSGSACGSTGLAAERFRRACSAARTPACSVKESPFQRSSASSTSSTATTPFTVSTTRLVASPISTSAAASSTRISCGSRSGPSRPGRGRKRTVTGTADREPAALGWGGSSAGAPWRRARNAPLCSDIPRISPLWSGAHRKTGSRLADRHTVPVPYVPIARGSWCRGHQDGDRGPRAWHHAGTS